MRELKITDWIGWLSSGILIVTIFKQILKQWTEHNSKGVSKWLFAGQIASSIGFVVYSWSVHSWVFVVTNCVLLCANLLGFWLTLRQKKGTTAEHTRINSYGH